MQISITRECRCLTCVHRVHCVFSIPNGTFFFGGRRGSGLGTLVLLCFAFSKDLVLLLQDPVAEKGVRFLQLTPGEYFFTTVKVC